MGNDTSDSILKQHDDLLASRNDPTSNYATRAANLATSSQLLQTNLNSKATAQAALNANNQRL
jgi:hypothetical protein